MLNVLLRHALSSSLDVVLPSEDPGRRPTAFYRLGERFREDAAEFPPWHRRVLAEKGGYDMFVMHARFNVEQIRPVSTSDSNVVI